MSPFEINSLSKGLLGSNAHFSKGQWNSPRAFTLLEITIATMIIGVIGAFAVTNYYKTIWKAELNYAYTQAKLLHGALEIFKAKHG